MTTLDDVVARWAQQQQLTEAESATMRSAILAGAGGDSDDDPDWLWDLLKPVTALLDGPRPLREQLARAHGAGV